MKRREIFNLKDYRFVVDRRINGVEKEDRCFTKEV
jgi:hypothetical protein